MVYLQRLGNGVFGLEEILQGLGGMLKGTALIKPGRTEEDAQCRKGSKGDRSLQVAMTLQGHYASRADKVFVTFFWHFRASCLYFRDVTPILAIQKGKRAWGAVGEKGSRQADSHDYRLC